MFPTFFNPTGTSGLRSLLSSGTGSVLRLINKAFSSSESVLEAEGYVSMGFFGGGFGSGFGG